MTVVITCYDLPAEGAGPDLHGDGHRLHRALGRPPAAFCWIDLAELDPAEAVAAVADAAGEPTALSGRYQAFHVNQVPAEPFSDDGTGSPVVFVNCMRFDPDRHDDAFAAWERINAYMVRKPGYRWHRLHRRLHEDAPFGLVNVVEWESAEAWTAAHDDGFRALTGGDLPFTAHPTLCLPVPQAARAEKHEEHAVNPIDASTRIVPAGERPTTGRVTLINSFVVPPDGDEEFHALWGQTSRYFTAQPGFVSLRLHRAVSAGAPYRWVSVAVWTDETAFRAALASEEFPTAVTRPGWERFPSTPVLFEVVTTAG
jgi:heme-degrading monooxygenase HmoA